LTGWLQHGAQSHAPLTDGARHVAPPLSAPNHEAGFNTPEAKAKFKPSPSPTRDMPIAPPIAVEHAASGPDELDLTSAMVVMPPGVDCLADPDAACRESLGSSLDPHMVPAARLHGDLDALRVDQSIDARFALGLPNPKKPSSRKRKTDIDNLPKYRLKGKVSVGSYVTRTPPPAMKRPSACITIDEQNPRWEVREHFRDSGKPYYSFRHPDGVCYHSKKQARVHGFKVS
jgi:hypothetical protein